MGGAPEHPQWYRNLRAHPDVEASTDGHFATYRAHEAQDAERERLWKLANELYPGYDDARWNESLTRLLLGEFELGWELYECRWSGAMGARSGV